MSDTSNSDKSDSKLPSDNSFTLKQEDLPELLRSVEEIAIFGFWKWNIQTGKVLWSDHLFSMFGRDKEVFEPSFENFILVVHDKDKEYVVEQITAAVEQRKTLNYYFTGVLPTGEERVFQTWGGLKLDAEGNPHRVVGIVIDNTDLIKKKHEIRNLNDLLTVKNQELHDSNQLLTKKHDEKIALIKETHHRIKNNLQIVNSLLRFQSSKIRDTRTKGILKDIENRIFSISSLHEKLYKSHDLRHINIKEHIEELISELIKSNKSNVEINPTIIIDDTKLNAEQLIPLGLILNELVSNSIEHAFMNKKEGEIHLSISSNAKKEMKIVIGDNGSGMSTDKSSWRQGSVGLELVNIFAGQLNGDLVRLDKSGTYYELTF